MRYIRQYNKQAKPVNPRNKNCRTFMTCLINPNTGSNVHLRNAYNCVDTNMTGQARPGELAFNPTQMWSRQKYFSMVAAAGDQTPCGRSQKPL